MRHNGLRYPWWVRCLMSSRNVEWQSRDRMCDTQLQCQFPALIGPRRKDQGEFHSIPHSFRNRRDHCRPEVAYAEDTPSVASDELLGWMAPTARDCDWGCIGCPVVGVTSVLLNGPLATRCEISQVVGLFKRSQHRRYRWHREGLLVVLRSRDTASSERDRDEGRMKGWDG